MAYGGGEAGYFTLAIGKHNAHITLSESQYPNQRGTSWLVWVVGIVTLLMPSNPSMATANHVPYVSGQGKHEMVEC